MSQARSTSPRGARSDTASYGATGSHCELVPPRDPSGPPCGGAPTRTRTRTGQGATTSTPAAIHERHSDLARALSSSTTRSLSARLASRQINLPGMPLLPHLAQGLDGRPLCPRPTPLRFLHALDPAQHLALEVRRLRVAS